MKTLSRCAALAAAVGIGYIGALSAGSASAETLRLQGSTGFANDIMSRYQGDIEMLTSDKLKVTPTSSVRGLVALFKGETDLAMVAAPLETMIGLVRETHPDLPFHLLQEFRVVPAKVSIASILMTVHDRVWIQCKEFLPRGFEILPNLRFLPVFR